MDFRKKKFQKLLFLVDEYSSNIRRQIIRHV